MRLIDEEVLMNEIRETITEQSSTFDWMNLIHRQPVAYDVDKVVEQMKESSRKMVTSKFPHKYYRAIGTRKCEQIVRAGGKE